MLFHHSCRRKAALHAQPVGPFKDATFKLKTAVRDRPQRVATRLSTAALPASVGNRQFPAKSGNGGDETDCSKSGPLSTTSLVQPLMVDRFARCHLLSPFLGSSIFSISLRTSSSIIWFRFSSLPRMNCPPCFCRNSRVSAVASVA
jgi:hypothetical protein